MYNSLFTSKPRIPTEMSIGLIGTLRQITVLTVKMSTASKRRLLIITCNGTRNCKNSCYNVDSRQRTAEAWAYSHRHCFSDTGGFSEYDWKV